MARIPEADIERIKNETDLAALVRSRGIELKNHGTGNLIGKCPFHDDDEPSFIVTPAKGLYHCMGCGVAGNSIQFVEKFDGISFRHAFELLNDGKTAFNRTSTEPHKRSTIQRLKPPVQLDAEDAELMEQAADYYHERLLATPAACDYLKKRSLFNKEVLKKFKIGFADRTLGLRLPDRKRKAGTEIRTRLQKLGLIRKTGHEHFSGSIVIPIKDPATGKIKEMYGRKISDHLRKGTPKHLYLPGPHAGIWNWGRTMNYERGTMNATPNSEPGTLNFELILCEAPLDALTFYVQGIHNVTFIFGTEGFTDELFNALLTNHIKRVKIAYDADEAGNRAAERDAKRLISHGIDCYRIRFPLGMDANSYAVAGKNNSLVHAVKSAEFMDIIPSRTRTPAFNNKSLAANNLVANKKTSSPDFSIREDSCVLVGENNPAKPSACPPDCEAFGRVGQTPSPVLIRAGEYHTMSLGQRHYRISGLDKNNSLEVLKITLRLTYEIEGDTLFHLDNLDMTRDGDRRRFIERAHEETGLEKELIKRDMGKLLLAMESAQQERINAALEPDTEKVPDMSAEEYAEAMELLKDKKLIDRIKNSFPACGLAGESQNLLAAYLACTSRKLDKPLAVIIQSTSAAGKSTLMEAVLAMFPEEERVQYSAMTSQSLYYLGETNLKHKILAIVEEEGAEKASYALKLLQSEGELTIASTGKNPNTGRMETQEYHVEGPVMIFLTTTAIDIDEELQNRCLTLTVDESREQTEQIHSLQRQARTLEGLQMKKQKKRLLTLLKNSQRLLKPVDVVNPYANQLTFTADRTRTRRDHEKYLTLIDAITLLHQHQRPKRKVADNCDLQTDDLYVCVTLDDIELANELAPELLGRSLDELPPQSRRLLNHIKELVRNICREKDVEQQFALFSRRQLCEVIGWSYSQIKRHLNRLQELEYITARSVRSGITIRYELLVSSDEAEPATNRIGLLDVKKLRKSTCGDEAVRRRRTCTTTTRTGSEATLTPPCQNRMARLSPVKSVTKGNLANLAGSAHLEPERKGVVVV